MIGIPTVYCTGPRDQDDPYLPHLTHRRTVVIWLAKHVDPSTAQIAQILQESDATIDALYVNGRTAVTALTLAVWFTKHNSCHLIVPSADGISEHVLHKLDIKKEIEAANDKARGRTRDHW